MTYITKYDILIKKMAYESFECQPHKMRQIMFITRNTWLTKNNNFLICISIYYKIIKY